MSAWLTVLAGALLMLAETLVVLLVVCWVWELIATASERHRRAVAARRRQAALLWRIDAITTAASEAMVETAMRPAPSETAVIEGSGTALERR